MRRNPFLEPLDPRLFDTPLCVGCGRRATDTHHIRHKAMGGRKGAAREQSERAENKVRLCRVCHAASHGLRVTESDGFWCGLCRRARECRFGARIAGYAFDHLESPWTPPDELPDL